MNMKSFQEALKSITDYKSDEHPIYNTVNEENNPLNFLHSKSQNLKLTYAEKILITEGSKLGKADCALPPYVEFESIVKTKEKVIRSEIAEWLLNPEISKIFFPSGALIVNGATFLTSENFISKKTDLSSAGKGVKYSLDLSTKNIHIDLNFEKCNFHSGINISNSYCESFVFTDCSFGSSENKQGYLSILADNISLKGDFIIKQTDNFTISSDLKKDKNELIFIHDSISFYKAQIEGEFSVYCSRNHNNIQNENEGKLIVDGSIFISKITSQSIYLSNFKIQGNLHCTESKILKYFQSLNLIFKQSINLYDSEIKNVYLYENYFEDNFNANSIKSVSFHAENCYFADSLYMRKTISEHLDFIQNNIENDFIIDYSSIGNVNLNYSIFNNLLSAYSIESKFFSLQQSKALGQVILNLAYINALTFSNGFFSGFPTSINASGLHSKAVFLSEGCFVKHGFIAHKSVITADVDCDGSIFGPSLDEDCCGISIGLSSSIIKNFKIQNHAIVYGKIDLMQCTIEDSAYFNSSKIFAMDTVAIDASYIHVNKVLSFNAREPKASNRSKDSYKIKLKNDWDTYLFWQQWELDKFMENLSNFLNELPKKINSLHEHSDTLKKFLNEPSFLETIKHFNSISIDKKTNLLKKEVHLQSFQSNKNHIIENFEKIILEINNLNSKIQIFEKNEISDYFKLKSEDLKTKALKIQDSLLHNLIEEFFQQFKIKKSTDAYDVYKNNKTIIKGEANFKNSTINGKVDLTGSIFKLSKKVEHTNSIHNKSQKTDNLLRNNIAINFKFANIQGSLFANGANKYNGGEPLECEGEINLEYAYINNFFFTSGFQTPENKLRPKFNLKLIGTKYNYISDDFKNKDFFFKAKWLNANKNENNYRQPYEQFANSLLNAGEDVSARNVLIYQRPLREKPGNKVLEKTLMFCEILLMNLIIRPFYRISGTAPKAAIALLIFISMGALIFHFGYLHGFIEKTGETLQNFNPFVYSSQKLIPIINGSMVDNFTLTYSTKTFWGIAFILYDFIHSIIGVTLISMFLINIARIRKTNG